VLVVGTPDAKTLNAWRKGVMLDDGQTAPAKVRVIEQRAHDTRLEIVMREGRKRQIRRVASLLGHPVKQLIRTRIEFLEIGHLRPGQWRTLSPKEVHLLKEQSSK
jgi:23S rRNA pseudouridine2605 synthase